MKNNSQDVIKITSENSKENKLIKVNKTLSLNTGINFIESGDIDNAIKFFKEYEDFYSKNPKYYYYLGKAYYKKGLYKESAGSFEKSLLLNKNSYDLYFNIAEAYEKAKLKNKASENYADYIFNTNQSDKINEVRNKINSLSNVEVGTDIIGRISLSDRADVLKNFAIGYMQAFSPDTPIIFASVEFINAKKTDKININWNFINSEKEILPVNQLEFNISGSKTVLLSIKSPVSGWPSGKYEMRVLVNNVKNSSIKFYVF